MLKTIDRLIQFIEYADISARQFDLSIGAANGYTLRMKKNHASIGSDVLENILKTYPQLNVVWLLTGEGKMIKEVKEEDDFEIGSLSEAHKRKIEAIIEKKIKERQEKELKSLLKEVTDELKSLRGGAN